MEPTPEQRQAVLAVVDAIGSTIRELGQVPAGHLYVQVMDKMSANTFNRMIEVLVASGTVRREPSHMLVWIGP
jgi:hypothetical protein